METRPFAFDHNRRYRCALPNVTCGGVRREAVCDLIFSAGKPYAVIRNHGNAMELQTLDQSQLRQANVLGLDYVYDGEFEVENSQNQ